MIKKIAVIYDGICDVREGETQQVYGMPFKAEKNGKSLVLRGMAVEADIKSLLDVGKLKKTEAVKKKPLEQMNKDALSAIAKEKGIDLDSNESKDDLIAKIKAAD